MPKVVHQSTHIKNLNSKVKIFSPSVKSRFMFFMSAVMFSTMNLMIFASSAYATDAADTKSLDFTVTENKNIEVSLSSSSVALNIEPNVNGQFGRSSVTINVSTNNTTGYNLTMQANTDTLTRSAQVNNTSFYINPLSQSITCSTETASSCTGWTSSYANNQWGYRIDSGTSYTSMTSAVSSAQSIKTTSAAANTSNTTVYFGAKLDNAIPTGSYTGVTLTFIATTNPTPVECNPSATDISSAICMQDVQNNKSSIIASMTTNTPYTLIDSRDEEEYVIAKLVDGKVWMLDNLRLDLTDTTTKTNMTSATTNASDTALNCLTGRTTGCTSPYTTAADVDWVSSDSSIAAMSSATYATTINSDSSKNYGNGSHMYGVYYNFCAASAGSYCMEESTPTDGDGSGNANQDICPAGWRMPTGNSTGEWGVLDSLINNNTASDSASIQARLSLPLSGYFSGGSAYYQGSGGSWWSSTWYDGYYMYLFYADATGTDASGYSGRDSGCSMRCLMSAPKTIDSVSTLQDFASLSADDKRSVLDSMTENQAYEKTDSRDGQTYKIAKLADGNIWFLDNLRLDLTNSDVMTNLTSATTNASETALNCLTGRTTGCTSPYTTAAVGTPVYWTFTEAEITTDYSITINSDSSKNYGNGSHMYGVYYNFCAASAGSYCYDAGASTGNASEDICPAGWRMPTGNSTGEWGVLDSLINNRTASNSASIQARLSLPLSGLFYDGSAYDQGSSGLWWSSTRYDGHDAMYHFSADATGTNAAYYDNRDFGLSMRCLFSAS